MKLAAVLVVALGCAPRAMPVTADHPAHPDAPSGRLAGPPAALRPGVANIAPIQPVSTPRAQPPVEDHSQHDPEPEPQPKAPAKPKPKAPAKPKPTPAPAQPPAHQGHQGHEGHH